MNATQMTLDFSSSMSRRLVEVFSLHSDAPPVFDGEKDYVSTGAVDGDRIDEASVEIVTFDNRPSRANLFPREGDILFAKMASTNKTLQVVGPAVGRIYSTGFFAVSPKTDMISRRLLFHYLCSEPFHRQKDKLSTGATMKGLTNAGLEKILIKIPPRSAQDQLASILDRVCELRAKRQTQLAHLNALAKSQFVEMFRGERNQARLDEIADVFTGTTPSMKVDEFYRTKDIPFFKPSDLSFEVTHLFNAEAFVAKKAEPVSRMFNPGAVLVTCIGATIGKLGIAAVRGTCNQQINFLVPRKSVLPEYLAFAIQQQKDRLVDMASSTAVPLINKSQFSKLTIALPPIGAQREFCTYVELIDKSKYAILRWLSLFGAEAATKSARRGQRLAPRRAYEMNLR